jgi:hypothetical protein
MNSTNPSKTVRLFLSSDVATAENEVDLCFQDVSKLNTCIKTIVLENKKAEDQSLDFYTDGPFFGCNDRFKFKISLVKKDVIVYDDREMTTSVKPMSWFKMKAECLKRIIMLNSVVDDTGAKAFFSKDNEEVRVEIINKTTDLSNSVSIIVSDKAEGDWVTPFCCSLENMRTWNPFNQEVISVTYASGGFAFIESEKNTNTGLVTAKILCQTQKK